MKTNGNTHGWPLELPPYTWFLASAQTGQGRMRSVQQISNDDQLSVLHESEALKQTRIIYVISFFFTVRDPCSSSLTPVLTPLLTTDPVAQTGTQHLFVALVSGPTLSFIEVGPRVCAACSLSEKFRLGTSGGQHNSTCCCVSPNR